MSSVINPMMYTQNKPKSADYVRIDAIKTEGNQYFKSQQLNQAKEKYLEAVDETQKCGLDEDIIQLEKQARMNLAIILAREDAWDEVIIHCRKVLSFGNNEKAFYRLGQALFHQQKYEESHTQLQNAIAMAPNDASIVQLANEVRKRIDLQPLHLEPTNEAVKIKEIPAPELKEQRQTPPVEELKLPGEMPDMQAGMDALRKLPPGAWNNYLENLKNMDPSAMARAMAQAG